MIYKDALGMWHQDRWKSIVGAAVNLVLNMTLVQLIGVSGVIISTIISYLFVEMPWETHVLYKQYFERSEGEFYVEMLKNFAVTAVICTVVYTVSSHLALPGRLLTFLASAVTTVGLTMLMIVVIYGKNENFRFAVKKLKSHLHRG